MRYQLLKNVFLENSLWNITVLKAKKYRFFHSQECERVYNFWIAFWEKHKGKKSIYFLKNTKSSSSNTENFAAGIFIVYILSWRNL